MTTTSRMLGGDQAVHDVVPSDDDLALLLLIRHFEQALLHLFARGHVSGTTHTCLGQEVVPVTLTPLLTPAFVFSNHRGHGHYLAQFGEPASLLAELTARVGGVCDGRGGSQHLFREGFCATGVQGESVPAALGMALNMKRTGRSEVAVAYIGDGTLGEGVVYETMNMAQLWRAPLVLVVENNGIAQTTATVNAMAGSIAGRAAAFGMRYAYAEGIDITYLRAELADPIERTRAGEGPLLIEFRTDRLGPHSKGDDTREAAVLDRLRRDDWYPRFAAAEPERFARIDQRQRRLVDQVVDEVLSRPRVPEYDR
uniref:Putative TPP-dependent dehydrogenase E1 n=1 Tax=Amycolatopsis sp. SANK 60206 TaxID=1642649 RepID=A0A0E3Z7I7_9PSEU|nr:putative TPP-dependent dehydrogenase E1 [Amycolatopsis sp. SANK 60206]